MFKVAVRYVGTLLICGFLLIAPGAVFGGEWLNRRLGVFSIVLSGEETGSISQSMTRDSPGFGLMQLTFCIAIASIAVSVRAIRSRGLQLIEPATSVALYFGMWVLLSAPYALNGGGRGGFATLFYLIPLTILSVSLFESFRSSCLTTSSTRQIFFVPVTFLIALTFVAGIQSPNSLKEWRRVQMPVSGDKWVDEWSLEKLDWIRPMDIVTLAESVGSVHEVGWWYSHGNAIELLTGIENLLGANSFEAAEKTKAMRNLACEPLTNSSLRYVITHESAISVIRECKGVELIGVSAATDHGMVLVSLKR